MSPGIIIKSYGKSTSPGALIGAGANNTHEQSSRYIVHVKCMSFGAGAHTKTNRKLGSTLEINNFLDLMRHLNRFTCRSVCSRVNRNDMSCWRDVEIYVKLKWGNGVSCIARVHAARYFHSCAMRTMRRVWLRGKGSVCHIDNYMSTEHLGQISAGGIVGLVMHFMIWCLVAIVTQTQPKYMILNFNANSHGYEHVICSFLRCVPDVHSAHWFFLLKNVWKAATASHLTEEINSMESTSSLGPRAGSGRTWREMHVRRLIYFYIKNPFGLCSRMLTMT